MSCPVHTYYVLVQDLRDSFFLAVRTMGRVGPGQMALITSICGYGSSLLAAGAVAEWS